MANIRPKVTLNQEINMDKLNWSTWNYYLFCVDTARKTNTTSESASEAEN